MQRWGACVRVMAFTALVSGTARGAAIEGPASPFLPPGINGADIVPAPPLSQLEAPAPSRARPVPSTTGVTFERTGDGLLIAIQMAGAAATKLAQSGAEVLLSFPRALPSFNTQSLLDQAHGVLEGVSVGFDTLLLQLAPGIAVSRTDAPNSIRLALQPGDAENEAQPGPAAPDQGELRLRLLDAQLLAQSGETAEARKRLQALLPDMPSSPNRYPRLPASISNWGGGDWR